MRACARVFGFVKGADVVVAGFVGGGLLRFADHAAVPHQRDVLLLEGGFKALELGVESVQVAGVAGKEAHAERFARFVR